MTARETSVPLALLASEWGLRDYELAGMLGDRVFVDAIGVRRVWFADAACLFEQREAEQAAREQADATRLEQMRRESQAQIDRVVAIGRHQDELRASGAIQPNATALEVMCGAAKSESLDRAGTRLDALLAGECWGESLSPPTVRRG
jgi:hypothetical protein